MGDSAAVIKWHENIVDFGLFYIALELEVFSVLTRKIVVSKTGSNLKGLFTVRILKKYVDL